MIALSNVYKQYGAQILFVDASFALNPGEKVGLVGPNGAGKSTLFRMLVGEEQPDEGQLSRPKHLTVAYFRQDVGDMRGRPVLEEALAGAGEVSLFAKELAELEGRLGDPDEDLDKLLARYGDVQARFQELGGYELEARAQTILAGLGFDPEQLEQDVGKLSGGWKMRLELAKILLARPDLLLLDEPTNYLDIESILWLEGFLRDYPGTVLMTCHDRDVLDRVVKRIVEIDAGNLNSYTGNYAFYEQARALEASRREAEYARQQAMLQKEMRFVERFKTHVAKAAQVQSRLKKLDKIEKIEPPRRFVERSFEFRPPPRSGDDVIKLDGLCKAYGRRVLQRDLSLLVRRSERWAVMGENGAGKSTLLKMMAGVVQPDAGRCELGASVAMGYFAQHSMETLDASRTVLEELLEHTRTVNIGVLRNAAGAFGFQGDDVEKPISVLSGGELARLALLKIMFESPNLLILDEPTNHLDLATKKALVRSLADNPGTLVFVSHDRAFLRAMATRVLELSGGQAQLYPGSYDEYVQACGREAPGMREAS
ncbi:MAG: ABC-F family ATP-binding cassette domain-containing protein [Myxococcota bacterium]|jgi:ATPase subunit of ABC transporter with duplicated ATPase domains|nr:ABC-F family ATP-binding cassette domain-containing protein [Myxococcota bacterium]